jgi:7,8-dihydropterin-6-yl-methyl-4-(beta-D-ribofuranosyl)aminobenzene 5'-phosphate synthase
MTSLSFLMACAGPRPGPQPDKGAALGITRSSQTPGITILYDAFSRARGVDLDWGFSALVVFEGKRILFDTGNDAARFERNVKQLGVDLSRLDYAIISHRHGDHASGLKYLLSVNPKLTIYAPDDEYFGGVTPPRFFTRNADPSLPAEMRYFNGAPPSTVPHGTAWGDAKFVLVSDARTIAPGIRLVTSVSDKPGTRDLRELSLVLDTPTGAIVVVGCSHPGIAKIVGLASQDAPAHHVRGVVGGLHMVDADQSDINATVGELLDQYKVDFMAPGHCTGERMFSMLQKRLGKGYIYAGVGETVALP